jgi:hypothetical protein
MIGVTRQRINVLMQRFRRLGFINNAGKVHERRREELKRKSRSERHA